MRWVDLKARRRAEELQEELDKLKRGLQDIQLEWNNVYDKLRSMMGRIAKRADRVDNASVQPDGESAVPSLDAPASAAFPGLNQRQARIQMQILSRRRGLRKEA